MTLSNIVLQNLIGKKQKRHYVYFFSSLFLIVIRRRERERKKDFSVTKYYRPVRPYHY